MDGLVLVSIQCVRKHCLCPMDLKSILLARMEIDLPCIQTVYSTVQYTIDQAPHAALLQNFANHFS